MFKEFLDNCWFIDVHFWEWEIHFKRTCMMISCYWLAIEGVRFVQAGSHSKGLTFYFLSRRSYVTIAGHLPKHDHCSNSRFWAKLFGFITLHVSVTIYPGRFYIIVRPIGKYFICIVTSLLPVKVSVALWAERDLYRPTPALKRRLGFNSVNRSPAPN